MREAGFAATSAGVPAGMKCRPGRHKGIEGEEYLDKVISIDQSPIGRTPRPRPGW